ncbi:sigma-54-dependent Fis family transcriptional regulator [Candidatus Sumerlaeota bacterium]|nr:sigma-54-dependent Fis family transcriptional regulator [Candidatus Sumerlaeota bacterium]
MPPRHHILVVDDEKNTREGLKWALESREYEVAVAPSVEKALEHLRTHRTDLIVTDLKMPGLGGLELLEQAKADDPTIEVIVITAHSTVKTAVEAMRKGAYDYQTKPISPEGLHLVIERALHSRALARENERLHREVQERYGFQNIIGRSPEMEAIFKTVVQVAPTRASVMIQGESGTGKELIAKAIHFNSPRARLPFIPLNCGALAPGLLESELFGHEKGAFTGAIRSKPGRFEMAHRGTILLDEISETTPDFQVRLLRVLQEQSFERVGGTKTIKVDVRVIAATNRNLEDLIAEGKFRDDLYYRLNVISITLPPLRDRSEDIPLLATAFLKEFAGQYKKEALRFSPRTMAHLQGFDWPGNVRQLRNVVEGLVVMANTKEITPRSLPEQLRKGKSSGGTISIPIGSSMAEVEKEVIRATLVHLKGNRMQTAKKLGIGRKTLYRKMEEYGIE